MVRTLPMQGQAFGSPSVDVFALHLSADCFPVPVHAVASFGSQ